jgi:hypothetical protein
MSKYIPWYKRNYLVDPKVQLKIVLFLAGIALVAAVTICLIAYERLIQLGALFNHSAVPPAALPRAFEAIATSLMFRLISIVVLMVIMFSAAGIALTHRIAGPIWKLQVELRRFLAGEDVRPIQFRRHDEFQELPDLINELMDGYEKSRSRSTKVAAASHQRTIEE